ncbi:MAG: tetratricopeptide repeat protein [Vicinamibacterales bacterium]
MRTRVTLFIFLLVVAPATFTSAQPATDLADAGWRALQDDDADAATRAFTDALTSQPRDALLHMGLGAAAHLSGREDDAIRALRAALDLDPGLSIAARLLGEIAWRRGDLVLAMATFESALAHAPDNTEIGARLERLHTELARRAAKSQLSVSVVGQTPGGLGEHAVRVAQGVYWHVARLVGAYPAQAIRIELDTARPFNPGIAAPMVARTAGGGITIEAGDAQRDMAAFDQALAVELVHAMVATMAPTGVPPWFAPGLALVVTSADVGQARRRLVTGGAIPWSRFDGAPAVALDAQVHDDLSLLLVKALLGRIGARCTQVLDGLAEGQSLDRALAPFGFSYADLRADVVQALEP